MRDRIQLAVTRTVAAVNGWGPLTDEEAAEVLVALSDTSIRDTWWLRTEESGSSAALALWSELVARAVPPYDAAPLFLLGWTVWRHGDGVLARMAAERALGSDPDYLAASLLLDAIGSGVDPRRLPSLAASLRRRGGRAGGPHLDAADIDQDAWNGR
jgi:hypothetical protein